MDVIVRSNNNRVNTLTALMSGLINDLDKVIKIKRFQIKYVWLVIVVDCQSGYLCHQQDKLILGCCLCNQESLAAVQ